MVRSIEGPRNEMKICLLTSASVKILKGGGLN